MLFQLLFHETCRRRRCYAAFFLFGLIILLGAIPNARDAVGAVAPGLLLHAMAYGTLAFLLFTGLPGGPSWRGGRTLTTVAAMGACDELMQSWLPYRVGSVGDWLIDISAAAIVVGWLHMRR